MTDAAQQFLRSFNALPATDQEEVLVNLLRLSVQTRYAAPSDENLVGAADEVFLELERAEKKD